MASTSRAPRTNQLLLDWLHSGVQTGVITINVAHKMYLTKIKNPISLSDFSEILFDK